MEKEGNTDGYILKDTCIANNVKNLSGSRRFLAADVPQISNMVHRGVK